MLKKHDYILALLMLTTACGLFVCAIAQVSKPLAPVGEELRMRVVDNRNLGIRAEISLSNDVKKVTKYTDWSGNVTFSGLSAGDYIVIISAGGAELYRNHLKLKYGEGFRSEVLRLQDVTFTDPADKISLGDLRAPPEARRSYLAGIEAMRAGNLDEALQVLDGALAIYPEYSQTHNARGVVLHMSKRTEEAEKAFREAIRLDAGMVEPRINLGNLLLEHQRASEAKLELQRAFELDSENLAIVELLVDSLVLTHEEPSAVSLMQSLHRRTIKHPARIHLQIASALKSHGLVYLAAEQYSLALQDDPSLFGRQETDAVQ